MKALLGRDPNREKPGHMFTTLFKAERRILSMITRLNALD